MEPAMHLSGFLTLLLAGLVPQTQTVYQAKVLTFGCNSSTEVVELQRIRSDSTAFQKQLYAKIVYGQCIAIAEGAVVEAVVEKGDPAILRIAARTSPPGYMAPVCDFTPVAAKPKS
jgi:hypothetical protein